jgi:hypothetical protein
MMAVIRIDAQLIDHLEGVLAPVLRVDEGVVERRAVIAGEAVALAKRAGGGEDIGRDDFVEEALELAVAELDPIQVSNFSLKFASSVTRSRTSGRYSYLRSCSFVISASSSRRSGVIIAIAGTDSFCICRLVGLPRSMRSWPEVEDQDQVRQAMCEDLEFLLRFLNGSAPYWRLLFWPFRGVRRSAASSHVC